MSLCVFVTQDLVLSGRSAAWFWVVVRRGLGLLLWLVEVHADLPCSAMTQGGVLLAFWGFGCRNYLIGVGLGNC